MRKADGTPSTPPGARNLEAGPLLIGAAAILLFVSLLLDWYEPGIDAWTVFEVWDLVLALLAAGALVAAVSRLGYGPPRPAGWLLGPAIATLVIVVYAILDPPPATAGLPDGDPGTGLWLALVAGLLMAAGAVLSVARISVAITATDPSSPTASDAPADPAVTEPTAASRGGSPLLRRDEPGVGEPGAPPTTDPTRRR